MVQRDAADHFAHGLGPAGQCPVHLAQHRQIAAGAAVVLPGPVGAQVVAHHDQLAGLGFQPLHPGQNGGQGLLARPLGAEHLVGHQVAHALQQGHPGPGQGQPGQTPGAFQRLKPLGGPHGPVAADAPEALFVIGLHGGDVKAGSCPRLQHQLFGVFALSAGAAAQNQCQHGSSYSWWVYPSMWMSSNVLMAW